MNNVTALTIVYRTPELIARSYGGFRQFYPDVPLLIFNNSGLGDDCTRFLNMITKDDPHTTLMSVEENIGHGDAFHNSIGIIKSKYIYYFDSDAIMYKGGIIEGMLNVMSDKVYGISQVIYTDMFGRNIPKDSERERLRFLYLVIGMLNREMYFKFHKFTKFGLVNYRAMLDIHEYGKPDEMLVDFPVQGYVRHLGGGTRSKFGDCEDIVAGFRGRKGDMSSELD